MELDEMREQQKQKLEELEKKAAEQRAKAEI